MDLSGQRRMNYHHWHHGHPDKEKEEILTMTMIAFLGKASGGSQLVIALLHNLLSVHRKSPSVNATERKHKRY